MVAEGSFPVSTGLWWRGRPSGRMAARPAHDRDKLTKKCKAEAIKAIKDVLSQLED